MLIALALMAIAVVICRHELAAYRDSKELGSDLFVYSRGRLWRRLTGVGFLLATAVTLAAFELFPAQTTWGASLYVALLTTEVVTLLVLPVLDLWETGRTARPEDLTRQADPDRQKRTQRHRPRSATTPRSRRSRPAGRSRPNTRKR